VCDVQVFEWFDNYVGADMSKGTCVVFILGEILSNFLKKKEKEKRKTKYTYIIKLIPNL